ncbi:MAG: polyprenyl synthetase family protein [Candidatus Bathyarchaeota archaeon]|nr:MAG: polyprenyl synthetase family protein [Candidatus Bathyarchaeota archaeon]
MSGINKIQHGNTKGRNIAEISKILMEKGRKSIDIARHFILEENIKSLEAREALRYYVNNCLSYTPPAFLSLASETIKGKAEKTAFIGAAITMFVGAIDIHDDIIDQSDIKNFGLTVYGKFGNSIALLAGDALLFEGFSMLNEAIRHLHIKDAARIVNIIKTTFLEMGDAHALEVRQKGNLDIDPETYFHIIEKKAASIEAYTTIGGIFRNGNSKEIQALTCYGRNWGILSTIRNDFIDIFERDELKNRMVNEVLPLPVLYTFKDKAAKKKILNILMKTRLSERDLNTIVDMCFESKHVKNLKAQMEDLIVKTINKMSVLRESEAKNVLIQFISGMTEDL